MTLDEVIELQRKIGLVNVHVAYLGDVEFSLAHTNDERARGENDESCPTHDWLASHHRAPAPPGIYMVLEHEPDAYSEPYGAKPWDLIPIEIVDRV